MTTTQPRVTDTFPNLKLSPIWREPAFQEEAFSIQLRFSEKATRLRYRVQQLTKRTTDITLASLALLALSPALLTIAAMIKFSSPGPVLYKSLRIGKDYKPFHMYKFRTMNPDADKQREALRKEANLEGNLFKLENDPRVTPIGRFLRAYSLDEFPQLLNVLRGEMSLVGPRPLPPDESEMFDEPYTLRFKVFPGLTGLWQISGRSNLDFTQLCKLEMNYVLGWSYWNDLKIIFKTIPAVLASRGAY